MKGWMVRLVIAALVAVMAMGIMACNSSDQQGGYMSEQEWQQYKDDLHQDTQDWEETLRLYEEQQ